MTFILSLTLLSLLPLQRALHPHHHHLFDFLALKAAVFFLLILARLLSGCLTLPPDGLGCLHKRKQNLRARPYRDVRLCGKIASLGHIKTFFFLSQMQQRFALTSLRMPSSPSLSRRIMTASSGQLPAVRRTVKVTWSVAGQKPSVHELSDHKRRTQRHRGLVTGAEGRRTKKKVAMR